MNIRKIINRFLEYVHVFIFVHIINKVDTILAEVDLTEQKNTEAKKLSGGQQRKLSLALALIGDPKVWGYVGDS